MAKVVKSFAARSKRGKYEQYLDGQIWALTDEDAKRMGVAPSTMRNGLNESSKRLGVKIHTSVVKGVLYVQAERNGKPPSKNSP